MPSVPPILPVAAALLLSACATTHDSLPPESPALSTQNSLLASLQEDEPIDHVMTRIPYPIEDCFDFAGTGHRTTFVAYRNDDTGAQFALVFVDGRLSYAMPRRESSGFLLCRRRSTPVGMHWSEGEQTHPSKWLSGRSVLGKTAAQDLQNPGRRRRPQSARQPSATEDALGKAVAVGVYAPFLVVGSPALAYQAAQGKFSKDALDEDIRKHREYEALRKRRSDGFLTIDLGMSEEQVTVAMGESDSFRDLPKGRKYLWFDGIGILLRDGNVILKERYVPPYWDIESIDRLKKRDSFWIRENHFDPATDCAGFSE